MEKEQPVKILKIFKTHNLSKCMYNYVTNTPCRRHCLWFTRVLDCQSVPYGGQYHKEMKCTASSACDIVEGGT